MIQSAQSTSTPTPTSNGRISPADRAAQERNNALADAISRLEKQYGTGAVMRLGDEARAPVETISTGSISLDLATGCGGYPRGRVIEIYGPESSGKTTLTLHAIAQCQAAGGVAAFIDAEHALDATYAASLGVDLDSLLVAQPDDGEQALDICEQLVMSGGVDLVVVDSVAALVPRAELAGEMGDTQVGLQARLMSKALRKLTGIAHKTNAAIVFINQLRQKIGVSFGPSEVTAGGNALKYYASLRLDVRRVGGLKDGQEAVGNRTRVRVVKNKLAPPFRQVEFDIIYGKGISSDGELIDLAESRGFITKSGSWFSLGDVRLGNGKEKARDFLATNPEVKAEIREMLLKSGPGHFEMGSMDA
jgi:recombination protein RecA